MKHAIAFWCFNLEGEKWSVEKTCEVANKLGCTALELIDPEHWNTLKQHGLICSLSFNGMPSLFVEGFNNTAHHERLVGLMTSRIDECVQFNCPNIIAFVGYKYRTADDPQSGEIPKDEAFENCVAGLKQITPYAEQKGVTICLEHLNTRDDSHPMKGHPGYQGDDLDLVAKIIREVDSSRLKLLFDVYHVQVMHGDIIRRLDENQDILGYVHVAGNPGRGVPDSTQEINYRPVVAKLKEVGYEGFIGQEFIPTGDPLEQLRQSIEICTA